MQENGDLFDKSGLTRKEAHNRLLKFGFNIVEEKTPNQLLILASKFWSPISWMLETTIILQLILGKYTESLIITALLLFNSFLSFFQEKRANKALTLLRQHLALKARALRDTHWQLIDAQELVPGDIVHIRMGDIVPADIKLFEGDVLLDQSALTGESMPVECLAGKIAYSGATIKRGEATGEAVATGKNTYFGKSVELIQTAKADSHVKNIIFTIIKYLITIDILLSLSVLIFSIVIKLPIEEIIPFILILIVASIPVALPATFTLATALGAIQLAKQNVLVTHLTAIEEAATMDVICVDKTGTITKNQLTLIEIKPFPPYAKSDLLHYAALASEESTQDPIDQAILATSKEYNLSFPMPQRIHFIPFDPTIKRTESIFKLNNNQLRIIKGTPNIIASLIKNPINISSEVSQLAEQGYRIIAVAVDKNYDHSSENHLELAGLIAFDDPPRSDSKLLLQRLNDYGLRILMLTGDTITTAKTIAANVGMNTRATDSQILAPEKNIDVLNYDIFAGMFPEDKFNLVKRLQNANHIVGMTGDGINDAPALKQAAVGIAVTNATDVAKAAASIVLTQPGLSGILSAVEISRRIYQRMLTYILNKIVKSFEIAVFLSLGVILTGDMIITPFLIVLLLFTNDFVTMSIATDNVPFSHKPERWKISSLTAAGGIISILILIFSFSVFFYARNVMHLTLPQLQTLIFVMLVFTGQGNVYLLRERRNFWHSLPSRWLIFCSVFDIFIVILLATQGILMTAISLITIIELLLLATFYLFFVDLIKIRLFSYFKIH